MMFIFIDTETTGPNCAVDRIIQVAWLVVDRDGVIYKEFCELIKPDGFVIPSSATRIHGISTDVANREGVCIDDVLCDLDDDLETVDCVVGHNVSFDLSFLKKEFLKAKRDHPFSGLSTFCTMRASTKVCALPKLDGRSGYKWPTLSELYFHLFGEYFDNAHDALVDVKACEECFFELAERGVFDLSAIGGGGAQTDSGGQVFEGLGRQTFDLERVGAIRELKSYEDDFLMTVIRAKREYMSGIRSVGPSDHFDKIARKVIEIAEQATKEINEAPKSRLASIVLRARDRFLTEVNGI